MVSNSTQQGETVETATYVYVRGLVSRICLILERYIAISGYAMQSPDSLKEAIVFFQVAEGQQLGDTLGHKFDPRVVNRDFVHEVLRFMLANGTIGRSMESGEFCEFAVCTLKDLIKAPNKASREDLLIVHDFCCTTEIVVDRIVDKVRNRVSVASITSYLERAI